MGLERYNWTIGEDLYCCKVYIWYMFACQPESDKKNINLMGQFLWFSSHQGDRSAALAFLFVLLFSVLIQVFFYLYCKNAKNRNHIEVNYSDFSKISSSLKYTQTLWEDVSVPVKIKGEDKCYGSYQQLSFDLEENEQVKRLLIFKDLLDKGVITEEEYELKKKQILSL